MHLLFEDRSEKVDAYIAANTSKDDFFKILMNERKWEFGGENMRWKDLVRWNKYSEVVRDVFYEYYGMASYVGGDNTYNDEDQFSSIPLQLFWQVVPNPNNVDMYPNKTLNILDFYNLWGIATNPVHLGKWLKCANGMMMELVLLKRSAAILFAAIFKLMSLEISPRIYLGYR